MEKGILTLYTAIGDPGRIPAAIQERFRSATKEVSSENGRTTLTLQDDTQVVFNLSHQQDKPEFIASHTTGMANFFSRAETRQEELKEQVLQQIRCFNCVTGISFDLDENSDRTNFIVNALYEVAGDVHGFLLYPDMHIYTSEGKLLFSSKGESELTEFVPTANADLLDIGRPAETESDKERCRRSIAQLEKKDIPYMDHLRSEVTEGEAVLKGREQMVQRAAALFAVAVYSEALLSENPNWEEALTYFNKVNELYGAKSFLTPAEESYVSNPEPDKQACIQFVWRYECCGVLLWAAGVTDELPYPSEIIDVPVLAAIFWQHKGINDLLSKGFPRAKAEILDAADLTLRYDWACVDARVHGKEAPASLDSGIVMERHYAFNWIIGANDGADWDNIRPNT